MINPAKACKSGRRFVICSGSTTFIQLAVNQWVLIFALHCKLYKYKDSYIIHGEIEITRLDQSGRIIWQVSARDIFVNIENNEPTFKMLENYIELMDWQGYRYKLSYDGIIVDDVVG